MKTFDKRVRALIGPHDRQLADRIGDILVEIHAAALVEASQWSAGRDRDAWSRFANRMLEYANLSIDLPVLRPESKPDIEQLKSALKNSLDKIAQRRQADEGSFAARESYDDATRGTFDAEGRVRS